MADTLATLKKEASNFDKLNEALEQAVSQKFTSQGDERFWYPDVDKAGNGGAIIRFLPAPVNESVPFVRVWSYRFQGPTGAWYSERSLTTLGLKDPVGEYNSECWNTNTEEGKAQARRQKRKLTIYSNIYVVSDPLNKDNEGKVFLYRYGKKLWNKIHRALNPLDPNDPEVAAELKAGLIDEEDVRPAFNPFDPWGGANLRLKIKTVGGFRNYDDSKFLKESPLFKKDEELENVWKQEYGLSEFVDPKLFKSYEELKAKLNSVMNLSVATPVAAPVALREVAAPSVAASEPDETEVDDLDLDFLNDVEDED